MKKLFFLSLIFVANICCAQVPLNVSINNTGSRGKYLFQEPLEAGKHDLIADKKAMEYINFFSTAIENPNTPVEVNKDNKLIKILSFTKKLVKTNKKEIIYDNSKKTISLTETKYTEEKNSFIWISVIILIALVVISNILFSLNHKDVAQIINLFVFLATLIATFNATTEHFKFFMILVLIFIACIIVMCVDKSGGVAGIVLVAPLAILAFIICISIISDIFKSGFTFFILIPASIMALFSVVDSDYDKKEEVLTCYASYSFMYYLLMIIHIVLLLILY